jgi:hypothetical protein
MSATQKSTHNNNNNSLGDNVENDPHYDNVREEDYDDDDQRDLIENERDVDNHRHNHSQGGKAMDGCMYLAVHAVLVCLSFVMLSMWLSYGQDECPSF